MINLNTPVNRSIIQSKLKDYFSDKLSSLETNHVKLLRDFEEVRDEHFVVFNSYILLKEAAQIRPSSKPEPKGPAQKLNSTIKKKEINIDTGASTRLESHSVTTTSKNPKSAKSAGKLQFEKAAKTTAPKTTKNASTAEVEFSESPKKKIEKTKPESKGDISKTGTAEKKGKGNAGVATAEKDKDKDAKKPATAKIVKGSEKKEDRKDEKKEEKKGKNASSSLPKNKKVEKKDEKADNAKKVVEKDEKTTEVILKEEVEIHGQEKMTKQFDGKSGDLANEESVKNEVVEKTAIEFNEKIASDPINAESNSGTNVAVEATVNI